MKSLSILFIVVVGVLALFLSGCRKAGSDEFRLSTRGKSLSVEGFDGGCRLFFCKKNDDLRCSAIFVFSEDLHRKFLGDVSYGVDSVVTPFGEFELSHSFHGFIVFKEAMDGEIKLRRLEVSKCIGPDLVVSSFADEGTLSLDQSRIWSEMNKKEKKDLQEILTRE